MERSSPDYAYAVVREAARRIASRVEAIVPAMLNDKRMALGDVELSDAETVEKVADMMRAGVLSAMEQHVNPREAQRVIREGAQAVERMESRDVP